MTARTRWWLIIAVIVLLFVVLVVIAMQDDNGHMDCLFQKAKLLCESKGLDFNGMNVILKVFCSDKFTGEMTDYYMTDKVCE